MSVGSDHKPSPLHHTSRPLRRVGHGGPKVAQTGPALNRSGQRGPNRRSLRRWPTVSRRVPWPLASNPLAAPALKAPFQRDAESPSGAISRNTQRSGRRARLCGQHWLGLFAGPAPALWWERGDCQGLPGDGIQPPFRCRGSPSPGLQPTCCGCNPGRRDCTARATAG